MCLDVYLFSSDVKKKKKKFRQFKTKATGGFKDDVSKCYFQLQRGAHTNKNCRRTGSQEVRMNLHISETISAAAQRVWSGQGTFSFLFVSSASFYSVFPCFNGAIFF